MILDYILVGLGGALGALARVALGKLLPIAAMGIPVPILCINVLGCFFMGGLTTALSGYGAEASSMRTFLATGCLGGFTTFSAFAFEFGSLYEKNFYGSALLYATFSVTLSLIFFFVGAKLSRVLF